MSTAYDVRDEVLRAFNDHDLRRLSRHYSPSAVLVGPEGVAEGLEQIVTFYEHLLTAFPDARLTPWYKATCSEPAVTESCAANLAFLTYQSDAHAQRDHQAPHPSGRPQGVAIQTGRNRH